ncbi:C-type lectin domain family 4 member E-like [Arapaima gigas]
MEMDLEDIYSNADVISKQHFSDLDKQPKGTSGTGTAEPETVGWKKYRLTAVCLGLLCVTQLIVIIVLCVHYNGIIGEAERNQNQMKKTFSKLTTNYNLSYNSCTAEKDQLQKSLRNYKTFQYEFGLGQACPLGWTKFISKCYFISSETISWAEGQEYCRQRGANLVIINSKEEQEFISNLKNNYWIGLSDRDKEGTWKWVDGSTLTGEGFWETEQPDDHRGQEDCVETRNDFPNHLLKWNDLGCKEKVKWICEK